MVSQPEPSLELETIGQVAFLAAGAGVWYTLTSLRQPEFHTAIRMKPKP